MKKVISLFLLIVIFFSFALPVNAQFISLKDSGCLAQERLHVTGGIFIKRVIPGNIASLDCVPYIVANIIFWALVFSGVVAVFILIIGGIKLLVSGGDAKQVEGARKTITWAIIGLIVIILSFAILRVISQVTGVGCITRFGFTQCVPSDVFRCGTNGNPGWCPTGKKCIFEAGGGGRYICVNK